MIDSRRLHRVADLVGHIECVEAAARLRFEFFEMDHGLIVAHPRKNGVDRSFDASERAFNHARLVPVQCACPASQIGGRTEGMPPNGRNNPPMERVAEQPQSDDRDLVLAFQNGSPGAYDAIYRRHGERVRGVCSRLLRNPHDAEEAVQETFLRAYQALGRFNGRYELGAWLGRIATNVCVDHLRSRSRHGPLALVPWMDHNIPDGDAPPDELIAGSDPRVDQAIETIRPLHATALRLRALHGLSHREMAGRLAMSPDQVKALLHRARRSFRRAFDRAGNWALGPFVGLSHLLSRARRSAASGESMAILGGPAGGAVAERMMAGALVVAIVFTGSQSPLLVPEPSPDGPDVVSHVPREPDLERVQDLVGGTLRVELAAEQHAPEFEIALHEIDLVPRLRSTVEGAAAARPNGGEQPPEGEGGEGPALPTVPTSSEAHEVVEEIQQTVPDVSNWKSPGAPEPTP